MKVLIYCRVSSDEQREGTSLDVQEERLRKYCQVKEYEIIDLPCREDESKDIHKETNNTRHLQIHHDP